MEHIEEFWFDDDVNGLAFDGRIVEIFGPSDGNQRFHVKRFGWDSKGSDKQGNHRVHIGLARKPGKISAGVIGAVAAARWPELEALLRRIDASR